jgi:hypothetical protein
VPSLCWVDNATDIRVRRVPASSAQRRPLWSPSLLRAASGKATTSTVRADFVGAGGYARWQYRRLGQHLYMRPNDACSWTPVPLDNQGRPAARTGEDRWGLPAPTQRPRIAQGAAAQAHSAVPRPYTR